VVRKPKGRDYLEDVGVDGRIIIVYLRNRVGSCGSGSFGSGQGPMVGSYEQHNKPLGSIKGREFQDKGGGGRITIKNICCED
jgi:hypothetical protein